MILKKSGRVSQPCRLFYNPNDSINNGKEIYVSNKLVIYFRIVVILTVQRYFFFSIRPCFFLTKNAFYVIKQIGNSLFKYRSFILGV